MLHLIASIPQGPLRSGRVKKKWKQTRKIIHLLCLGDTRYYLCRTPVIRLMCIWWIRPLALSPQHRAGCEERAKVRKKDLHLHFVTYLQGLHGAFPKPYEDWNIICTGLPGAEDVLKMPADLRVYPGPFITLAAPRFQMNSSHHLSVPFLFSIRAGKGTTPHIHCNTNFTPTQRHSEGVMENGWRMSETNKRQRQNMLPWPWE